MVDDGNPRAVRNTTGDLAPIRVQVCYAKHDEQFLWELQLPAGSMLKEALAHGEVRGHLDGGTTENYKMGIYGKIKPAETLLRDRDRVEIYRPLQADPKDARRRRVKKNKASKV